MGAEHADRRRRAPEQGRSVDIPMGEFWTPLPGQKDNPEHLADVREAASAAHIYGKPLVAAESFTSIMPRVEPRARRT